jgi:hypothetical protein
MRGSLKTAVAASWFGAFMDVMDSDGTAILFTVSLTRHTRSVSEMRMEMDHHCMSVMQAVLAT